MAEIGSCDVLEAVSWDLREEVETVLRQVYHLCLKNIFMPMVTVFALPGISLPEL